MKLSIVSTLYYSSQYIEEFYSRIKNEADRITKSYEIIFVDDGSPDNSLEIAVALSKKDKMVKVVELSRNFGHHKAIVTGLEQAKGEYIFLIDSDLEEKPELLGRFWKEFSMTENEDIDVLYGVQQKRKGKWLERYSGVWFYFLFNWLSDRAKIETNFLTVRLMKSNYLKEFLKYRDQEYYFAPSSSLAGFNQKTIEVKKGSHSPTTYNFFTKYNMLINAIFSYSNKPLYFIFYFGIIVTLIAFSFGVSVLIRRLLFNNIISGWSSLILSISFFSGIIIMFLGIIAIYISKIFRESRKSPFSIIKKIHSLNELE